MSAAAALLALALLAFPASADEPEATAADPGFGAARIAAETRVCRPLPGVGCWYAPDHARAAPPLLVYLRGHHPVHRAAVPPAQALDSARQAFAAYLAGPSCR